MRRRRQRHPGVAAHAAIPADAVLLAGDNGILGPEPGCVGPDQLVAPHAADEQLPVKARPETARLLRTWRLCTVGMLGVRGDTGGDVKRRKGVTKP